MTTSSGHPFLAVQPTRWRLAVCCVLALGGCTSGPDLPPLPSAGAAAYHLGPGDQVRLITYDEPQLTNTFTVGANGGIEFPLIGAVQAAGLSADGLAQAVAEQLQQRKLLTHPSVSAEIATYRPIFVLGEVNHPGQYPYQPNMTMLSAVAMAGGFTYRAVKSHAGDVRSEGQEGGHAAEGTIGRGDFLEPGDVVTIYERYL